MIRFAAVASIVGMVLACVATAQEGEATRNPWTGKYPMSFFTRMRSANTVGKNKLSVALKLQSTGADEVMTGGCYCAVPSGAKFDTFKAVTTAKYGWAKNHHIALGVPYMWVDFKSGSKETDSDGFSNVFVFEKWRCLQETRARPALAFDVWYYAPTGDPDDKLGDDKSSVRVSTEVSKAFRYISLHLMPGYKWNLDGGCDVGMVDAGFLCPVLKSLLIGAEYNYTNKEDKDKGESQDVVPGFIWKPFPGASVKVGAVVNVDCSMKYKDDVGVVAKLFYKKAL